MDAKLPTMNSDQRAVTGRSNNRTSELLVSGVSDSNGVNLQPQINSVNFQHTSINHDHRVQNVPTGISNT